MTLVKASRLPRWATAGMLGSLLGLTPAAARGYTTENPLEPGCHERITADALRTVRGALSTAPPLPASENDQALIDDLQFIPPSDVADLGGATLLVGVRDNDMKGRSSDDLSELSGVAGDPDRQQEHCLRSATQDEPTGTSAALTACRAFIRTAIQAALTGLDGAGKPDPTRLTTVTVHLSVRGQVDAPLPTFYLKMGQALHAVEDGFAHSYRTPDQTRVTVLLNWIDKVNGTLVESRDGPAHAKELDRCDDPDALRATRRRVATLAATAVLRATLVPTSTPDEKMAEVDKVLDAYLSYSPGCTFANGWCNAPERSYADSGCGCHAGRSNRGYGSVLAAGLVAIGIARRSRRRRGCSVASVASCALALLAAFAPRTARAQETTTAQTAPCAPSPEVAPPVRRAVAWGARAALSGSFTNAAAAAGAGVRLQATESWWFGLDGEWNPWLAYTGKPIRAGAVNVYGTAIFHIPLHHESFSFRSTLNLGTSYLASNLYGAPQGSIGIFAALAPLGVEWKASRNVLLVFDPLGVAVPAPLLKTLPLTYVQYRIAFGVEVYAL